MRTDEMIRSLAADLAPVSSRAAAARLAAALALGAAVSGVLMVLWLGLRSDLADATTTGPFWIKFAYTLAVAGAAFWTARRLSVPAVDGARRFALLAAPLGVVLALAGIEMAAATPEDWRGLMMGGSAGLCPWRIVVLSLPVLGALFLAVRSLAPTRLRLAGLAAGLAAGGAGAVVYSFHCDEVALPFLALWYSLGVAATGALGALLAKPFLRW